METLETVRDGEWLSISEAAKEAGCTRANIHLQLQQGRFLARVEQTRTARQEWRIHRPSFEEWKRDAEGSRKRGRRPWSKTRGGQSLFATHV